ncbi:MAG: hypothetical protein WCG25_03205 [bacterium]
MITASASCSIAHESLRSESCGLLSTRFSTSRESCDNAIIGTSSSFESSFNHLEISLISCTLFVLHP